MNDMPRSQRVARPPDVVGRIERDGVNVVWEVYGDGPTTVLLLPTWSIVPSRFWKLQIPYLARDLRVVTFDGRGAGGSDRPTGAPHYADREYAADALAVLDATATERAVTVGLSCGVTWAIHLATAHPDRVSGLFAISPSCGLGVVDPARDEFPWDVRNEEHQGWGTYNRHHWLEGDFDAFREFFFGQMFSEDHSTKQIEDCLGWSATLAPGTLVDATAARLGHDGAVCEAVEALLTKVTCPVEVVHGIDDRVRTHRVGERLAELAGASLVLLAGAGHGVPARDPVQLNLLLRAFVDRACPPPPSRRTWVRADHRPRRALYVSSPIGLGHARRDLAVVQELRRLQPDLQVEWLAQSPVTRVLEGAGERVHPASRWLLSESAHIEDEAHDHDLHAFQAIRRMDEVLVNNFMVFDELVSATSYDLVVGDEAWEIDHFLHENPERKRFPFAWMTDFVGWLPMPAGGDHEAMLSADYNAEMIEQRARFRHVRDRSVFVGDPDDVVDAQFGPGLPRIREWTESNFDFAGYIPGFEPPDPQATLALRESLGCGPDQLLCVVTVGGSGVGAPLLRRVLDAVPIARRARPELRFLVVAGPRIDPGSLPEVPGADVVGYLPRLVEHLAACDVAVVQGGLTTCMELTASRTPFVYVPLENHFEQNIHVRHRLDRYRSGHHLSWVEARDPDLLAAAVVAALSTTPCPRPVDPGGAARAATLLADLL